MGVAHLKFETVISPQYVAYFLYSSDQGFDMLRKVTV